MKIKTNGKIAYWCKTEELAKAFLKECADQGVLWNSGDKPISRTFWGYYHDSTCYTFKGNKLIFGATEHFIKYGYIVIEYKGKDQCNVVKNAGEDDDMKDAIILSVKKIINAHASVTNRGRETIGLFLDDRDVDHIAEDVADFLIGEGYRKENDTEER